MGLPLSLCRRSSLAANTVYLQAGRLSLSTALDWLALRFSSTLNEFPF